MMKNVFLLASALRPIREVRAEIVACKKTTWAHDGDNRYLIGSTAFFTREEAERSKIGKLRKIIEQNKRYRAGGFVVAMAEVAKKQLDRMRTPLELVVLRTQEEEINDHP